MSAVDKFLPAVSVPAFRVALTHLSFLSADPSENHAMQNLHFGTLLLNMLFKTCFIIYLIIIHVMVWGGEMRFLHFVMQILHRTEMQKTHFKMQNLHFVMQNLHFDQVQKTHFDHLKKRPYMDTATWLLGSNEIAFRCKFFSLDVDTWHSQSMLDHRVS